MPIKIPTRFHGWNGAWLFTKVLVFLALVGASIVGSAGFAVWVCLMVTISTKNSLMGIFLGLIGYTIGLAGRDALEYRLVRWFFSKDDAEEINRKADEK